MRSIYLDHNATTPLLPEVWEAMQPFAIEKFGNAASAHAWGRTARRALEDARETIAHLLDAHADEIIFTSGATESNNLAIFGLAGIPPADIVSSPVEHPSVTEPASELAKRGIAVHTLPVDASGLVCTDAPVATHHSPLTTHHSPLTAHHSPTPGSSLDLATTCSPRLVIVQLANHETGALQPIASLRVRFGPGAHFHCDAAAAAGKTALCFHALGVTTLSLSAHKFHGPAGIGVLLLRRGTSLQPQMFGGHQQQGRRPGTEPVALAIGMARALELAHARLEESQRHVLMLRRLFLGILKESNPPIVINGPGDDSAQVLPHTLNVSFPGCRADALLMNLDLAGIACSTGSACSSGSLLPSPVLQAMGVPPDALHSAMRFSFSHLNTAADIDEAAHRVVAVVNRLRGLVKMEK